MAICVVRSVQQLDPGLVLTPERYNPKRRIELHGTSVSYKLSEFAVLCNDQVSTKEKGTYLVLNTSDAHGGCLSLPMESSGRLSSAKKRIRKGDVVISRLRPYLKQVAYCDVDLDNLVGSTEFYVLRPRVTGESIAFLLPFLLSDPAQRVFQNAVEGSQHPRFQTSDLLELPIPISLAEERERISTDVESAIEHYRRYVASIARLVNGCNNLFD